MEEEKISCKVCVTGGAGYVGSSLGKRLLDRGYTVHVTLRNLEDESKVGLLKSFPGADKRLKLFKADIFKAEEFEQAIQGCEFVFHVATALVHSNEHNQNGIEATVDAVKKIGSICIRSGTVKKLIYTASVVTASPLKDDGSGFKDFMDETCWTPLNLSNAYSKEFLRGYLESKLLAEKEILNLEKEGLEVVTLGLGVVGGNSYLSYTPSSVMMVLSLLTREEVYYNTLKFLEELVGKVPMVHIEDVCDAHIFSMEEDSINGRFLCASSFVSIAEIANYYLHNYPEFVVDQEYLNEPKREVEWGSRKLVEKGFVYKYGMKELVDHSVSCARKNGNLKQL